MVVWRRRACLGSHAHHREQLGPAGQINKQLSSLRTQINEVSAERPPCSSSTT